MCIQRPGQSWSNTNDSLKSNKQANMEDIFYTKLHDLGPVETCRIYRGNKIRRMFTEDLTQGHGHEAAGGGDAGAICLYTVR